ncbi:hypothetical protein SmJEL517_g04697 [Synchytrium microbalum]|uniref:4-coumarate--CoA ligase n=1 Tax=Synchytrium microbalum TaxID=1806994 RepID=A0A507BXF4_9FUNG|nr:uncharacterized protein SmJEL517_g04697 [Synchytrium microbalum]TPX32112.1 hypothetical protein SmJEL517_g04697 [Synchytrium microbalum]
MLPITDLDVVTFLLEARGAASLPRRDWPALIEYETDRIITFGEYVEMVNKFSAGIQKIGLRRGQTLSLFVPNHIYFPIVLLGTLRAGGICSPANPGYTADEYAYQLTDSKSKWIVTCEAALPTALKAADIAGISKSFIFLIDSAPTVTDYKTVDQIIAEAKTLPLYQIRYTADDLENTPAVLCYSSGTTGRSKGVETTHKNLVANVSQLDQFEGRETIIPGIDKWPAILPMFHIFGLTVVTMWSAFSGVALVVQNRFSLGAFCESVQKHKLTMCHVVPPIVIALAKAPVVSNYDFSSVRVWFSGAAPLATEVQMEAQARVGGIFKQGYGMTECSPVTHLNPNHKVKFGSIGPLICNMECQIVDPETNEVRGPGGTGEIWVRGPNVMKGYWNNAEATKNTITSDGWLMTGDIGYVDEDGYVFIVDRLKELIKFKGFQVPPAELEGYLLTHPAISDAAVIGRPDDEAGELPRGFIVVKPGSEVTEAEIVAFIAAKVANHKRLRGGVRFIDVIPKSASGKILRRELRDLDREEVEHAKKNEE